MTVIPFRPECWTQINSDTLLYHDYFQKGHWVYDSKACYFLDLEGNCINDEAYSDYQFCPLKGEEKLIELTQNGIPAIYSDKLEKLCDSCYFQDLPYSLSTDKSFVIINKNPAETFLQLVDKNLKPILPGKYLAIIPMNGYCAVLNAQHQIEYIPITE